MAGVGDLGQFTTPTPGFPPKSSIHFGWVVSPVLRGGGPMAYLSGSRGGWGSGGAARGGAGGRWRSRRRVNVLSYIEEGG
eukprot:24868-Hanusia_phi.AAC.3